MLAATLLSALLVPAHAAPAISELRALVPAAVEPPLQEKAVPAPVPEDLSSAAERWSNPAQAARLAGGAGSDPFTFAVIGDAEPGRFPWERVFSPGKDAFARLLRQAQGERPDFIVQLGDFVSEGTVENYRAHVKLLEETAKVPLFHAIGNHDRSRPNGKADKRLYRAVFKEGDLFFDHKGWRFVLLDTANRRLSQEQLSWLDRILDTPLRKAVFTHVPPDYIQKELKGCPVAEPSGDSPDDEGYWEDVRTGYFKIGAAEFDRLMSKHSVARVYMGHIHAYGAAERAGTRYILSGTGGSPHYPMPPGHPRCKFAHYLSVSAGPVGISETPRPLD